MESSVAASDCRR